MRIIGIDPGDKNIGIAISDPTGTIASPLMVLSHVSRPIDAATIAQTAHDHGAGLIIIGQALDEEGKPTYSGRKANRLAAAIRTQTDTPVALWDESHSTQNAQIAIRGARGRHRGYIDDLAATVILQTYLDSTSEFLGNHE